MESFFSRLRRRLRHLSVTPSMGRKLFPQETLDAITEAITEGELGHRGEVRMVVEAALPGEAIWSGMPIRRRALALFAEHGIWDTEDNCGVLLYVNIAEHRVEIVADRAIDRRIGHDQWQSVCDNLAEGFRRGAYATSSVEAIRRIHDLLRQHFPATGAPDRNELPDHPVVL